MELIIIALAVFLAIASLLPFVRREVWWIRVFDFPRIQILIVGLFALGLCAAYCDLQTWQGKAIFAVIAAAVLIQAMSIFRYTPLARKEVISIADPDPQSIFSLLVANVLMSNRRTDRLVRMITDYQPDVVLLLEPDAWWEEQLQVLEEGGYTYTLKEPLGNKYGMLLYSRLPLRNAEVRYLLKPDIPSMRMEIQLRTKVWVLLHAVHPEPPSPTEADSSLPRDAELLMVAREIKDRSRPSIVAGDLNDVAWSHTTTLFQKISRLLDPRKGRGMFNSFHAKIPLLRWPLDHVFHSDHFFLADIQRLPAFGSDHFPVYLRLSLQPEAEALQEAPPADAEDAEAAQEKIAKAQSGR